MYGGRHFEPLDGELCVEVAAGLPSVGEGPVAEEDECAVGTALTAASADAPVAAAQADEDGVRALGSELREGCQALEDGSDAPVPAPWERCRHPAASAMAMSAAKTGAAASPATIRRRARGSTAFQPGASDPGEAGSSTVDATARSSAPLPAAKPAADAERPEGELRIEGDDAKEPDGSDCGDEKGMGVTAPSVAARLASIS